MSEANARHAPIHPLDVFGLRPLGPALAQCRRALVGGPHLPGTRFGLSSIRIFKPWLSLPLWLGQRRRDRRVAVYNLVNRAAPPLAQGYSVRVTDVRDFRGAKLTYDSHRGTDFAVPVGTRVVAPAAGVVRKVQNDMDRGGLKVGIDHGGGLITLSNHLSRALVKPGDRVARGQAIGLSGMSSLDGVLFFPWLAPHVHFTVLLAGETVDPFATEGEVALWLDGNDPKPWSPSPAHDANRAAGSAADQSSPTVDAVDDEALSRAIDHCRDPELRAAIHATEDRAQRVFELHYAQLFQRPAFEAAPSIYTHSLEPRPRLSLPFAPDEVSGIYFPDATKST